MNLCVIQGVVVGELRLVELPSGESALSFEVQTDAGKVPVEWTGPPKKTPKVATGIAIAVVGTVARRFYQAGGSTQTRVFVRPRQIVVRQPKRQRTAILQALEEAVADMT